MKPPVFRSVRPAQWRCVKLKPLIGFVGLYDEAAVSLCRRALEHFVELNPAIRLAALTFTVSAPGCKIHLNAKTSPLLHRL